MNSTLIRPAEVTDALNAGAGPILVDCRFDLTDPDAGFSAYERGHIPTAVYAHLDDDLAGPITPNSGRHPLPNQETFVTFVGSLGIDQHRHVVVYDDAQGAYAARLWWMLKGLGHPDVSVLDGGLQAYLYTGGSLEQGVCTNPATKFIPTRKWEYVTTRQLVNQTYVVVDARSAERYLGREEPIDSVAGHIPGAVNLPFPENLKVDGCFLDAQSIRSNFEAVLGELDPDNLVAMCGSGVTACHLLLAQAAAGLGVGKLYVGSWSEWIRDKSRPVATS